MKVEKWLVQLTNGHVLGPLTTAEVFLKIEEGVFQGQEKIKPYPEGRWSLLSQNSQFYERLLQQLERGPRKKPNFDSSFSAGATRPIEPSVPPPSPSQNDEATILMSPPEIAAAKTTIVLEDLSKLSNKIKLKASQAPLVILTMAAMLAAAAYLWPSTDDHLDKPSLLRPKVSLNTSISSEEQTQKYTKSLSLIFSDQYEGFNEAQNILVGLIEGAPQLKEGYGLLCVVYKELWPFVRQDSKDLETVLQVVRAVKTIEPVGLNSAYCEISQLMILGKYKDARGIVDYFLNQPQYSTSAILFSIKAEILGADGDLKSAALYAEKAADMWKTWVRPRFQQGFFLSQINQGQAAITAFDQVLKLNPTHRKTLTEYGALLFEKFSQLEPAINYLGAAAGSKSKITRFEESKIHLLLARIYHEQNNPKAALKAAERAYELNPGDVRLKNYYLELGGSPDARSLSSASELVFLGDQYARAGDCLSAQAEYKAAFDMDSKNAFAATKAAKCLWKLNQGPEAISWLNKAIAADKKFYQAYYLVADYASQRFNYSLAIQTLNKGAGLSAQNFELLRGYGLVEFRRNNFKDAVGFLERAIKIYGNDVETLILLSRATAALGKFDQAQSYALRAIELDGTNNDAQIVYAKAISQFQGVESGIFYIKDLISRFSYSVEFRLALAEIYRDVERYRLAQEIFEQIVELDPRNKKALVGLGDCQLAQGAFSPALKSYLNAAVLDPTDAEPLFKSGMVYFESAKYKDAITQFQRALDTNPVFPKGNYLVGKAAFSLGDMNAALKAAMNERRVNPGLADSYLLAAEVYSATRDYTKCATEYQQALKIRPQGAGLYVKLARCHRLAGNPDVAEAMLAIAAGQESGLADIYKEQGAVFEQKGDRRAAVHAYDKYLTLSPNAPDKREVEDRISQLSRDN